MATKAGSLLGVAETSLRDRVAEHVREGVEGTIRSASRHATAAHELPRVIACAIVGDIRKLATNRRRSNNVTTANETVVAAVCVDLCCPVATLFTRVHANQLLCGPDRIVVNFARLLISRGVPKDREERSDKREKGER